MGFVLGIDGGGTKTKAVILKNEKIVARCVGGPSNMRSIGHKMVASNIVKLVDTVCSEAGIESSDLELLSLGLAGVSTENGRQTLTKTLGELGINESSLVINSDAAISLYAAHEHNEGIMVIAGTGMAIFGQRNGKMIHSGGWGHLLGDEGSAYWLAVEAMKAILAEADGRGEKTALTQTILGVLNLSQPSDLIDFVYDSDSKAAVAALAPIVIETAADDDIAKQIICRGAKHLFDHVNAVSVRLDGIKDVCFVGSLIENDNLLRDDLARLVSEAGMKRTDRMHEPEVAAALMASKERNEVTLC